MNKTKMNILVLGNSGAGKSTLINAISGVKVQTIVGEVNTWPIRLNDTKGFEIIFGIR